MRLAADDYEAISRLRWSRSIGAQVASDACGQLGLAGKMVGEGIRVSLVCSVVPADRAIASCAIDGGLHTLDGRSRCCVGNQWSLYCISLFLVSGESMHCCPWRAYRSGDPGVGGRRKPLAVDGEHGQSDWAIASASQLGQSANSRPLTQLSTTSSPLSQSACRILGKP